MPVRGTPVDSATGNLFANAKIADGSLATDAETAAGTITDKATTPSGLASILAGSALSALYLDGTITNFASTPDAAAYTPTTSLDFRIAMANNDWILAGNDHCLAAQFGAAGQYSWAYILNAVGTLAFFCSSDGTALSFPNSSTVGPAFVDGSLQGLRVLWEPSSIKHYTKPVTAAGAVDELIASTGWTQLGTTVTAGVPATLHNSTTPITIGAVGDGTAQIRGGASVLAARLLVDGVVQTAPDFRRPTNARHRDPAGRIWTFTGSAYSWTAAPLA